MKRRALLAMVGFSVSPAGCLRGTDSPDGSGAGIGEYHPSPNGTALPQSIARTVRIVEADEIPDRYDTEATVALVEPRITTEHTAKIEISVRNTGDESREYVFDPHPPMGHERSVSGPGELLLARPDIWERGVRDCFRLTRVQHGDGIARVQLDPDGVIRNSLEIWDIGDEADECLSPGDYEFAAEYPRFDDRPDIRNTWAFTLRLDEA